MSQQVSFSNFKYGKGNTLRVNSKANSNVVAPAVSNNVNIGTTVTYVRANESGVDRSASLNNRVDQRTNQARLNERIPDIYGKVLSIPDLIAQTHLQYEADQVIQVSYFCVGRGDYVVTDVKENGTPIAGIPFASLTVFNANNSPFNSNWPATINAVGLISSTLKEVIPLPPPYTTGSYYQGSPTVFSHGPYVFDNCKGAVVHFIASWIAYGSQADWMEAMTVEVTHQLVDSSDVPFGSIHTETHTFPVKTRASGLNNVAQTLITNPSFSGRMQVKVRRSSNPYGSGTPSSHRRVSLTGIYGKVNVPVNLGNTTTLRLILPSTINVQTYPISLLQQGNVSSKLSCIAHRKIGGVATSEFSKIAEAVSLDSYIGNRQATEVDTASLTALQTEINTYFGTTLAGEFNYTFDDENISFEETLSTICNVSFITVYREGPVIKFKFEKLSTDAKFLFNHRNKLPGTELRTIAFGYLDDKDGVRYEYTDTTDGAKLFVILPSDESAINSTADGPVGITNRLQAYFHANRRLNRQKYQNMVVEFQATQEANLLTVKDRILVSDNTKTDTWDGEIVAKDGLILTLSQPFDFVVGKTATIFLQNIVGGVESILITEVVGDPYRVELDTDIIGGLSLSSSAYTLATYEIVVEDSVT